MKKLQVCIEKIYRKSTKVKCHSDVYLRILFSYTDIYWRWNITKRRFYQNWIVFWKTSHTFQSFLCWCQFSHIDSRLECRSRMPLMTNYQAKYMCGNSKTFLKREKVIFFNKMRARKTNLMSLSIKTSHFLCLLTKLNELTKSKAELLYTLLNVKCIEYIRNIFDSIR